MNPLSQTTRTTLGSREASPRTTWERGHLAPQKVLRIEKWVLPGQTQEKRQSTPPGHSDRRAASCPEQVWELTLRCWAQVHLCQSRIESLSRLASQVREATSSGSHVTVSPLTLSFISTSLAKKEESCRHGLGNVSPPSRSPGPPGSHRPGKTAEEPGSGDRFS